MSNPADDIRKEQAQSLAVLSGAIAADVREFCLQAMRAGGVFNLADLELHVQHKRQVTPGSAGRILRDLRRRGTVSYTCKSRTASLYCVHSVGGL